MFNSVRFRLAASFLIVVFVTLLAAALALFARLGGYRDDLTVSTLRSVAAPVYYNLTLFRPATAGGGAGAGRRLQADLATYLELQRTEAGIIVLPLDALGHVIENEAISASEFDQTFRVPPMPQAGPNFSNLPEGVYETTSGERLVYVTVPTPRLVRAQPAGIYALVVALPETERRDVWQDLAPRLLFAAIVGLSAAAVTVLVLWASLFRTLGKVTGGIRAVAAGDYTERVPESGPTELRTLAGDVNRMADSVQGSQRTLREFLANVSHELRTPLTSIRGFSQAMLDGTVETPEERVRAARVIDAESARVLRLVGELLDLSRIESGQQRMSLAPVRVDELLSHAGELFAQRAEEAGVILALAGALAAATVFADFDRIEQVLSNLMDNAFRHTPRGGRIELGMREAGAAFFELYVRDDGEGVTDADLPHVFDRFYRSSMGEPQLPGAGLGLAISREIVRAHGGTIRAVAAPGGGAEFAFTLPSAPHNRESAASDL